MNQFFYISIALSLLYGYAMNGMDHNQNLIFKKIDRTEKIPKNPISVRIKFARKLYEDMGKFPANNYLKRLPNDLLKEIAGFAAYPVYEEAYKKQFEALESAHNAERVITQRRLKELEMILSEKPNSNTRTTHS